MIELCKLIIIIWTNEGKRRPPFVYVIPHKEKKKKREMPIIYSTVYFAMFTLENTQKHFWLPKFPTIGNE